MRPAIKAMARARSRLCLRSRVLCRADLPQDAEHGRDVTVGQRALDLEVFLERFVAGMAAFEEGTQALDDFWATLGKIGQGAFFDPAEVIAVGLAQEDGGRRIAIGDDVEIHDLKEYGLVLD